MQRVNFTFDIDCTDYSKGTYIDEPNHHVPKILEHLNSANLDLTNWLVRIDETQISRYSSFESFLKSTEQLIKRIVEAGHVVGWHHHASDLDLVSEQGLIKAVKLYGKIARDFGLEVFRSGFGQMTTLMLEELIVAGFTVDSSCISRPQYSWTSMPFRDWSNAPNRPYYPCRKNYQEECNCQQSLIEIPITTVPLSFETDTQPDVRRYLNLAYPRAVFRRGFDEWLTNNSSDGSLVTITHPYETYIGLQKAIEMQFSDNIKYVMDSSVKHAPLIEVN